MTEMDELRRQTGLPQNIAYNFRRYVTILRCIYFLKSFEPELVTNSV